MKAVLLNCVIHAVNYEDMIEWYKSVFELQVLSEYNDEYLYTDLGQDDDVLFAITKIEETEENKNVKIVNRAIPQVIVTGMDDLLKNLENFGKGYVVHKPANDEGFIYAVISDPEGNHIWLLEEYEE